LNLPWLDAPLAAVLRRRDEDRLPHALLLSGPRGIGKRRLADSLLASLLCLEPDEPGRERGGCGHCRSCRLLAGGAHPERFEVTFEDDSRQLKVDSIRALTDSLTLTTTISPRKVALIHPAEAMNRNAANALLKSLEEPPGDAVLILLSHDPSRLPATILSRCQRLHLELPDAEQARAWLRAETGLEQAAIDEALEAAAGRPLLARELLEQEAVGGLGKVRRALAALLGRPDAIGRCAAALESIEAERLWRWLSTAAADLLRSRLAGTNPGWDIPAGHLPAAPMARLQQQADRNRRLADSSVRQDLLLREWLLEWARLGASRN
jgi:DNA polymerase-3 subunit delta'